MNRQGTTQARRSSPRPLEKKIKATKRRRPPRQRPGGVGGGAAPPRAQGALQQGTPATKTKGRAHKTAGLAGRTPHRHGVAAHAPPQEKRKQKKPNQQSAGKTDKRRQKKQQTGGGGQAAGGGDGGRTQSRGTKTKKGGARGASFTKPRDPDEPGPECPGPTIGLYA